MTMSDEAIRQILQDLDVMVEVSALRADVGLKDQGLDSLDFANLILQVEEQAGIRIPDEDIAEVSSIDALLSYLRRKAPSSPA